MEYWGEIKRRCGVVKSSVGTWRCRQLESFSDFRSRLRVRRAEAIERTRDWLSRQLDDIETVRTGVCVKTALCFIIIGTAGVAAANSAGYALLVNSESDIRPTDAISWNTLGYDGTILFNPTAGSTRLGIGFHAAKQTFGSMRIANETVDQIHEICLNSQNSSSVQLTFDTPVTAAGARIVVSNAGYSGVNVKAYDVNGSLILQSTENHKPGASFSKFMGVVSTGDSIKSIEFSVDEGVVSLGHVDLRDASAGESDSAAQALNQLFGQPEVHSDAPPSNEPIVPRVTDSDYSMPKNSGFIIPSPNVLNGSSNVEAAILAKGPTHAEVFQLFSDGSFYYRPQKDFSGVDEFIFAGTRNAGQLISIPGKARIHVYWINSQPSFKAGTDQSADEDSGAHVVNNWATEISAGSSDEIGRQKLNWIVGNDNPDLFSDAPKIDADGTLRFTLMARTFGVAHCIVWLHDDGGTENGGIDTSRPATFQIEVRGIHHKPVLTEVKDQTIQEGETLMVQLLGTSYDQDSGLHYMLINEPDGMTVNPITGLIQWTPTHADAGRAYPVTAVARTTGETPMADAKLVLVNVLSKGTVTATLPTQLTSKPAHVYLHASAPIAARRPGRIRPGATIIASRGTSAMRIFVAKVEPERRFRYWVE